MSSRSYLNKVKLRQITAGPNSIQVQLLKLFCLSGTFTCGTNHGSSALIYQMVTMDGKHTMLRRKRQVKVCSSAPPEFKSR